MKLLALILCACVFATATAKEKVNWSYTTSTDVLRKQTEVTAINVSAFRPDDHIHLAKVAVALIVKKRKDGKSEVSMDIPTPQKLLYCPFPKGCAIAARFDDGPVLSLKASKPTNWALHIVFQKPDELIRQIRKSKELIVEVPIEKELPEQHIFDLSDLRDDL